MKNPRKFFSIVSICCLVSIVFIPIGIVLMWLYTDWKKWLKIVLSAVTTFIYAGIIVLALLVEPANNTKGISLPFGTNKGSTSFETNTYSVKEAPQDLEEDLSTSKKKSDKEKKDDSKEKLPKSIKKAQKQKSTPWIYSTLFFLFLLLLIIMQNLRNGKKSSYENPYVDTNKYKLPLLDDAKLPLVHFLRLNPSYEEKILFATETNQKDAEGDFVITNRRIVIFTKTGNMELPINQVTSVASVTNSVIVISTETEKNYVFMHESQIKYAIAVLKWAFKKATGQMLSSTTNKNKSVTDSQ
ncbi:MAG: hypothetical protein MJ188_00115 [Treponema sp.]|nr:hypothetical protein [Treponema sp.]